MDNYIYGALNLHTVKNPNQFLTQLYNFGVTKYETARIYGEGKSEQILGNWFKTLDKKTQDKIYIITKGGCYGQNFNWKPNLSKKFLTIQVLISLGYLGKIDLYLLHRDDPDTPIHFIVNTINIFISNRYINDWGVSNWKYYRIQEAIDYCQKNNLTLPKASSIQYSILKPIKDKLWSGTISMDSEEYNWYKKTKFPILCWEVLAKGFILDQSNESSIYNTNFNKDKIDKLNKLSKLRNIPITNLAINYILSNGINSSVIIGSTNINHIEDNIKFLSKKLSKDEKIFLKN